MAIVAEELQLVSTGTAGTTNLSFDLLQEIEAEAGDIIYADIFINTGTSFTFGPTDITLFVQLDLNNTVDYDFTAINSGIVDGDTVEISRYLPKMKASDFMKDIITMYNMYMGDPDEQGNVLFEPIDDFYFGTDDVDPWSDKIARNQEIVIEAATNIKGKTYEFHWATDRDYYKKLYFDTYGIDYGDKDYDVPSTFKKGEKKYQLKSAQSCPVQIEGTDIIIPRIVKIDEGTMLSSPHKGKPRMFIYNGVVASDDWFLVNSDTLAITTISTGYPRVHHLDDLIAPTFDLNFGVPVSVFYIATAYTDINMFLKHHAQFIRELTSRDSKVMNAFFHLRETDFYLDFLRRLCNIDGVLYRKNLIKDYLATDNKTTKVELVKILAGNSRKNYSHEQVPESFEPAMDGIGSESGNFLPANNKSLYLCDTSGGDFTASMDPSILKNGKETTVVKTEQGNVLTVRFLGGASANGLGTIKIKQKWESITFKKIDDTTFIIK